MNHAKHAVSLVQNTAYTLTSSVILHVQGVFLKILFSLSLSFFPQTKNTSCKTHCFLPCQVCSGRRWRQQTARPPALWVRPPSQWLAACKTNLKADEWHLGARKHAGRPKIFAEAHTVRRMKGHYVNTWAPWSWGIFKVAPAPCIKPAKKQRHSFKSSMQEPHHNLAPEGRVRKGPQPRVPCFSSTAHCTGWFLWWPTMSAFRPSRHDQFSPFWQGKALLEDAQKATTVANGAWWAWDRGSYYPGLTKEDKNTRRFLHQATNITPKDTQVSAGADQTHLIPRTAFPKIPRKSHTNMKPGNSPMTKEEAGSQTPGRFFTNHIVHWDAFRTFLDFIPLGLPPLSQNGTGIPHAGRKQFCFTQIIC